MLGCGTVQRVVQMYDTSTNDVFQKQTVVKNVEIFFYEVMLMLCYSLDIQMDQCSSVAESDQQSDTDGEKNSKRQRLPSDQYNPHNMVRLNFFLSFSIYFISIYVKKNVQWRQY